MTKLRPPLDPECADEAPHADALTPYEMEHLTTYIRLLDAVAQGTDWTQVARIVLHIDLSREPTRARRAWDTLGANFSTDLWLLPDDSEISVHN